jgi:REP element-mobilizing transposase RayT
MVRPLRIVVVGGVYHVTARGVERRDIYRDDTDRKYFVGLLSELTGRYGVEVGGYAIMSNHYHVMVRLREPSLSRAFQWLHVSYSGWFNRRHRRVGHLFQGRYHSQLVEPELGWEVLRYIHLNPVRIAARGLGKGSQERLRQGIGTRPEAAQLGHWMTVLRTARWSSYRASVEGKKEADWLCDEWILDSEKQREAYRRYVEEGLRYGVERSPWEAIKGQAVLGSEKYLRKMKQGVGGKRREQPGLKAWETRPPLEQIRTGVEKISGRRWSEWRRGYGRWERQLYLYGGRHLSGKKLIELGETVGMDYASVSQGVKRFGDRLKKDKEMKKKWLTLCQLTSSKI